LLTQDTDVHEAWCKVAQVARKAPMLEGVGVAEGINEVLRLLEQRSDGEKPHVAVSALVRLQIAVRVADYKLAASLPFFHADHPQRVRINGQSPRLPESDWGIIVVDQAA
jgi:hypothetical protein